MATGLNELASFIKQKMNDASAEFVAKPYYEPETDSIIFYGRDVDSYSKRINKNLTLFLDSVDDSLVGIEIKGVTVVMKAIQGMGIVPFHDSEHEDADGKTIKLSILARCATSAELEQELDLNEVSKFAESVEVSRSELATC